MPQNKLEGNLSKESVQILLKAFCLNHEDEDLWYCLIHNLDKVTDESVKEISKALHHYFYYLPDREEAGKVLVKYGLLKEV